MRKKDPDLVWVGGAAAADYRVAVTLGSHADLRPNPVRLINRSGRQDVGTEIK